MSAQNITLSPIAWGAWKLTQANLSTQELNRLIHHCVEQGITSFDHADIYGSFTAEGVFGAALALSPELRSKIQLLTKCGILFASPQRPQIRLSMYNSDAAHIAASVDNSLKELRADALDVLMIHRPDFLMNADETASALTRVVREGKVRAVGVSNFSPSQLALLQSRLDIPLAVNQVQFSLAHRAPLHDGVLDQCQQLGVKPMAWSPLAQGDLFGGSEIAKRLAPLFAKLSEAYNANPEAITLAWLMRCPTKVMPVIGSSKLERITRAAQAMRVALTREHWYELYVAAMGSRLP